MSDQKSTPGDNWPGRTCLKCGSRNYIERAGTTSSKDKTQYAEVVECLDCGALRLGPATTEDQRDTLAAENRKLKEGSERWQIVIDTILFWIGNVDHSTGNGPRSAKMRGDMLNNIRETLKSAKLEI